MPLNKAQLTAAFTSIFQDLDPNATAASKAAQMADAIDAYVKTGSVSVPVPDALPGTFGVL
jgi:hypothetical protein